MTARVVHQRVDFSRGWSGWWTYVLTGGPLPVWTCHPGEPR